MEKGNSIAIASPPFLYFRSQFPKYIFSTQDNFIIFFFQTVSFFKFVP